MTDPATTRGVLYPAQLPAFHREPVKGDLAVFVRWFWIPEWDLAPGAISRQHLIGFPACNLVVEPEVVGLSGPTTRAAARDLTGQGWAVGALLRPAAVPALVGDVSAVRDAYRPMDLPDLASAVRAAMTAEAPADDRRSAAVSAFSSWLEARLGTPAEEGLLANRMVDAAETRREIVSVSDLAAHLHVSTRTVHRLAAKYVGLSPAALIRRRRLQEAAQTLRDDPSFNLTALAHDLGYSDHAHLTNEWRRILGFTPSDYRRGMPSD